MIWGIVSLIAAVVLFILDITGRVTLVIRGTSIKAWWIFLVLGIIFIVWDIIDRKRKKGGKK